MKTRLIFLSFVCFDTLCQGANYEVTTTDDSGPGSLRQAMTDANANAGHDLITFNIPGGGVQTLSPSTELPVIIETVTIDATTQPGYVGKPLIELVGANRVFPGLTISGNNVSVRGLCIRGFGSNSGSGKRRSGIFIQDGASNQVAACFIGVTADGFVSAPNRQDGILISNSCCNVIGGANATDRNIISGNNQKGIQILEPGSSNNLVLGNFIGLDATGLTNRANGDQGIVISNAPNNIVGGGNVISGNDDGILIIGSGATGNVVSGNFIGLKSDGTALFASPSFNHGIRIDNASSNLVGGTTSAARNVIGNTQEGVLIFGANAVGNLVQGNFIGLSPSGSTVVSNHAGVSISGGAMQNTIGGTNPAARNVISGNVTDGISINESSQNVVQGNYIGTDATGILALGNQTGVTIFGNLEPATNNLIGGTNAEARNIISGNREDGVVAVGPTAMNNFIQGNFIGLAADGNLPLGNGDRGVSVLGANSNWIGGEEPGAGNVIANNGLEGVWLVSTFGLTGTPGTNNEVVANIIKKNNGASVVLLGANRISANQIYQNTGSPIDRGGDGPTPNSPTATSNFPEISSAVRGSIIVTGQLNGAPDCEYRIEVFAIEEIFSFGEVKLPVGSFTVLTGADGTGTFDHTIPFEPGSDDLKISMTATPNCPGAPKETSEETFEFVVQAPPTFFAFSEPIYSAVENSGQIIVTVVRSGNIDRTSSVTVTTQPGPNALPMARIANSPADFQHTEATLSFAPGETSKTISIPIVNDSQPTGTRVFRASLNNPQGGGLAIFDYRADIYINEDDPAAPTTFAPPMMIGSELAVSIQNPGSVPVALQRASMLSEMPSWETIKVLPSDSTSASIPIAPDSQQAFFRGLINGPIGNLNLNLHYASGQPLQGVTVQMGEEGETLTGVNGAYEQAGFPAGRFSLRLKRPVAVTPPGEPPVVYDNFVDVLINLVEQTDVALKFNYAAETQAEPECKCTPWCAIVGGVVNGVLTVSAEGGANGFCLESPEVTITGPGGVMTHFSAAPIPKRKCEQFTPAASGTWTVTTTVCGKTKTCSITLE